ncbi:uncharacterized protein LOC132942523 [Metopolophium dirhodum]|uniref:uncharacterized protein LOC132942523 n=1 Tax=Metopolophium dirhodum TaxID=44670 RepID=UPI00298FFE14|nr:uncharacterized protein LOC132942523 [Metopolophium dirhodum]XP_060867007.1 uncharacterized protein LOC132942523 [Metopolophium dirhodum]XP_060867008.1 uncharacterized protein LOC132942523 [Metopolophium dirhodum]
MRRINRRLVLLSIVFVCDVVNVFGRPQEPSTVSSTLKDDLVNRKDAVATPIVVFAETAISAGDARAHTTKPPLMDDSVKSVSDQLLQTSTSSNMVVSSEVRTVQKNESNLKGEAVPVLTDEDVHAVGPYSYKISSDGSTRPTGDLSTWILLGGESSPAPLNMATIKKVPKPADATTSSLLQSYETSTTRKRKPTTEKMTTAHSTAVTESPIKLQDSKFKNKTPVIVGKIPTTTTVKDKVEEVTTPLPELPPLDNNTRFGTPVVTFPHVPPRQRPSANNTKKAEKPLTTKITSTAVVISKPLNNTMAVSSTTVPTVAITTSSSPTTVSNLNVTEIADKFTESSNSTTQNTSLKKKKKKKNKNKRKPVKVSNDDAQSKIDEQSTKITPGRPLSTRIYNYLAREVMPNVGVGLVGLMLTAGLAGLLLYSPLGGAAIPLVPLRRTDSHVHGHSHGHGPGYVPPETDNSQPEEQVFGQVLSGMSYGHNPYGRERPDAVPKYKSSYQPSEYPAVHDVPKYNSHDTNKYSAHDVTKYVAAADTTKYSTHDGTKYAVVESTKYSAPDTNTYSAPDTSKYSTIDVSATQDKVPYTPLDASEGPAFEQTQDSQDDTYQNHHYDELKFDSSNAYDQPKYQSTSQVKGVYKEDQPSFEVPKYPGYVQDVPKEEAVAVNYNFDNHRTDEKESSTAASSDPTFSALQGIPKFYEQSVNPEQISVNVHQTMKMEHGPRSLRIRRQVDEHNEIDAQLPDETTVKPTEKTVDKSTENQTIGDITSSTTTSTSTVSTKIPDSSELPTVNNNQFSLIDLLRRVAEVKLKMGIEILKNTAASFTQYVNAIQRKMTHMVRNLQKSNDRQQSENKQETNVKSDSNVSDEKRQRRSIRHRIYSN